MENRKKESGENNKLQKMYPNNHEEFKEQS